MREKLTINATTIKILAMLTMVLDHIGYIFYGKIPEIAYMVLRGFGRISFPLFAFCIAEGFYHTKNELRYFARVLIFALISEIPYNYFASGNVIYLKACNVLFTFAVAILVLWFCRYCDGLGKKARPFSILGVVAGMAFAYLIKSDYSYRGVALVVLIYYTRFNEYIRWIGGSLILWITGEITALFSPLAFALTHFYNGERGKLNKWISYFFYPLQLIVIGIIGRYL